MHDVSMIGNVSFSRRDHYLSQRLTLTSLSLFCHSLDTAPSTSQTRGGPTRFCRIEYCKNYLKDALHLFKMRGKGVMASKR